MKCKGKEQNSCFTFLGPSRDLLLTSSKEMYQKIKHKTQTARDNTTTAVGILILKQ